VLLGKAEQDEAAVRELLRNANVAGEIVAFHAQQAAEKSLRAVLAVHGVRFGRTHNIATLIDLAREAGESVPEWVEEATALTPFGVAFRYEDLSAEVEPLDREATYELVRRLLSWAEGRVRPRPS